MDTPKSLINRLFAGSYANLCTCTLSKNLLRFSLLIGILALQPAQAGEQGESKTGGVMSGEESKENTEETYASEEARIFDERRSELSDIRLQTPVRPDKISWEGISLHEAFIDRMSDVRFNVMYVLANHLDDQEPLPSGSRAPRVEMLPEVRVFADVMEEQGARSGIYDSLVVIAGAIAREEQGEVVYQVTPAEMERRPDTAEQGFKIGDWIRIPPQYDKISKSNEKYLHQVKQRPELLYNFERLIDNQLLPIVDKRTTESFGLGTVLRHFSGRPEFEGIDDLHGKLSAFAKVSYLSTMNEWARQNDLPQLDLSRHLPSQYLAGTVTEKLSPEQLELARDTAANISMDGGEPLDRATIPNTKDPKKQLVGVSSD